MSSHKLFTAAIILALIGGLSLFSLRQKRALNINADNTNIIPKQTTLTSDQSTPTINPNSMQLNSPAFTPNSVIPPLYTCDGDNINPPLRITAVPKQAQSLVLIMDDPDVPKSIRADGTWDHWIVFNIPSDTSAIAANTKPPGIQGQGTSGHTAYQGPCPPDKEHRYFFKLYALDIKLDLTTRATKQQVEQAMRGHILDQAELIGTYNRS